jgi:sugar phosphate isomerase/epimerase
MNSLSRRSFLAVAAAAAASAKMGWTAAASKVPLGLELYSVRDQMSTDKMFDTVRAVAKMGYECVEFYGPYYQWTTDYAKDVRKLLDDLKIKCYSTHNDAKNLSPDGIGKAIDLNSILGSRYVVMASASVPRNAGIDGWKTVAETLTQAVEKLKPAKLQPGFHNHETEFTPIDNVRPIEVLAKNTPKEVLLQLDVGTCIRANQDPVAWIEGNPGRIRSIHAKEYSKDPAKGYRVVFGDGDCPWKQVFTAAEKVGGVEFYLIEQEMAPQGMSSADASQKCCENFRRVHG